MLTEPGPTVPKLSTGPAVTDRADSVNALSTPMSAAIFGAACPTWPPGNQ